MGFAPTAEALRPILAEPAIGLLVVFGSRTREEHRPGSDLDLGALRQDGLPMNHRQLALLQDRFSECAAMPVDLLDLAVSDAIIRFEIVSQGRPLYETSAGAWRALVARTLIDHDDIAAFLPALRAGVGRAARRASTC